MVSAAVLDKIFDSTKVLEHNLADIIRGPLLRFRFSDYYSASPETGKVRTVAVAPRNPYSMDYGSFSRHVVLASEKRFCAISFLSGSSKNFGNPKL